MVLLYHYSWVGPSAKLYRSSCLMGRPIGSMYPRTGYLSFGTAWTPQSWQNNGPEPCNNCQKGYLSTCFGDPRGSCLCLLATGALRKIFLKVPASASSLNAQDTLDLHVVSRGMRTRCWVICCSNPKGPST